jgi:hypothetical protein
MGPRRRLPDSAAVARHLVSALMKLQEAFEYYRKESAAVSGLIRQLLAAERPLSAVDQHWRQGQMAHLIRRQDDAMKVLLALRGLGTPRRERTENPHAGSTPAHTAATEGSARSLANIEAPEGTTSGASGFAPGSSHNGATEELSAVAGFDSFEGVAPGADQRSDAGGNVGEPTPLHRNEADHQDVAEHASPDRRLLPLPHKNAEVAPPLVSGYEGLLADRSVRLAKLEACADSDIPAIEVPPPASNVCDLQGRSDSLSPSQADNRETRKVGSYQAAPTSEWQEILPRPIVGSGLLWPSALGGREGTGIRAVLDSDSVETAGENADLSRAENSISTSESGDGNGFEENLSDEGVECASQGGSTAIGREIVDDGEPVGSDIRRARDGEEAAPRLQQAQYRSLSGERSTHFHKNESRTQSTPEISSVLVAVADAPPPAHKDRFLPMPVAATDIAATFPKANEAALESVETTAESEDNGKLLPLSEADDPDQLAGGRLEGETISWMATWEAHSYASFGQDDELIKSAISDVKQKAEFKPLVHDLADGFRDWWNDNESRDEPFLLNRTNDPNPIADVKSERALVQHYDWSMLAQKCEIAASADNMLMAELAGAFNVVFGPFDLTADVSGALSFVDHAFPDLDYDFRNKDGHWAMKLGAHECRNIHDLSIAIYGAACLVLAARQKKQETDGSSTTG